MPNDQMTVSDMFQEMVRQGFITPPDEMGQLRLPGAYPHVPSIVGYATPEAPIRLGVYDDAELGQRAQRNLYGSSD